MCSDGNGGKLTGISSVAGSFRFRRCSHCVAFLAVYCLFPADLNKVSRAQDKKNDDLCHHFIRQCFTVVYLETKILSDPVGSGLSKDQG